MDKQNQAIPILEVKNVSKDFSGVYALKNVDLQIFPGEVTAIIGENGAGKSTLMKIVSGVHTQFDGTVLLNGEEMKFNNPKDAAEKGVVIIHQELNLIPYLSITENLFLGQELTNKFGLLDYPKMNKKAKELLARLAIGYQSFHSFVSTSGGPATIGGNCQVIVTRIESPDYG